MDQSAHATLRQSRLIRGSEFARRRECRLPYNYEACAVTGRAAEAERGDVTRRTAAHTAACTCVDVKIGARSAKPAARSGTTTRSRLGGALAVVVLALIGPAR